MSSATPRVTYYAKLSDDPPRDPTGVLRRNHDRPAPQDETFGRDGQWHPTDFLLRAQLLGSSDIDYVEITPEEADAIIAKWRRDGLVP